MSTQALTFARPTAYRGHICFDPGFIDEDKAPGIKPALPRLPAFALGRNIRPELFGCQQAFF